MGSNHPNKIMFSINRTFHTTSCQKLICYPGAERGGGQGGSAAPPDLLKNFLCISSILLINIVTGYLPLLTEATF